MKCQYCKEDNPPGRAKCAFCGEPMSQTHMGQKPVRQTPVIQTPKNQAPRSQPPVAGEYTDYVPDYLVQAILVTVCCCLPFGIVAIVYAARVKAFLLGGQNAMAQEASEKAKMWCWVGFGIGIIAVPIYLLMIVVDAGLSGF